jgi:hypothetical protein
MLKSKYFYLLLPAILLVAASVALLFIDGGPVSIIGNLMSKVFVTAQSQSSCPVFLVPGWNLISVYCEADNMSIATIFNNSGIIITNITNNLTGNTTTTITYANLTFHAYDPTDINDSWKVYARNLPSWVVLDLDLISVKKGYWVNTEEEIDITFNGTISIPNFIELYSNWNLVGFPINVSQPVADAIGDSAPNLITIHKYEPLSGDPWKVYSSSSPDNDLLEMEPNYGYWVNMNGSAIWIIDQ